jgi:hypothetical protein
MKYVLRSYYDEEGFDADGIGFYFYTASNWKDFENEQEILEYLQKNIYAEGEKKPANLKSIKEYQDTFKSFFVYKKEDYT